MSNRDISLTFLKGMEVLRAFDGAEADLSLADLSRRTGHDRATVRRLVHTLLEMGYVEKVGGRFRLTPRILVLAGTFLRGHGFGKIVQPLLNICAGELGFGVGLAMADGDHAVYVAQSTLQSSRFTFGFTLGSRLPLLNTSIGRMLLAWGDPDWTDRMLAEAPLQKDTARTLADRDSIADAVAKAMAEGHCVVRGEFEEGATGLSVPVGARGRTRAVLGLSEPEETLTETRIQACLPVLRRCAAQLRPALGTEPA